MRKIIYTVVGCISVACGAAGTVLPILPTFPFLLLAAYCFARSSERLHHWFVHTKLYKDNLESYMQGHGMTRNTKIRVMITVTIFMSVGFFMMGNVPVGRMVLAIVWVMHLLYFGFRVKTMNGKVII